MVGRAHVEADERRVEKGRLIAHEIGGADEDAVFRAQAGLRQVQRVRGNLNPTGIIRRVARRRRPAELREERGLVGEGEQVGVPHMRLRHGIGVVEHEVGHEVRVVEQVGGEHRVRRIGLVKLAVAAAEDVRAPVAEGDGGRLGQLRDHVRRGRTELHDGIVAKEEKTIVCREGHGHRHICARTVRGHQHHGNLPAKRVGSDVDERLVVSAARQRGKDVGPVSHPPPGKKPLQLNILRERNHRCGRHETGRARVRARRSEAGQKERRAVRVHEPAGAGANIAVVHRRVPAEEEERAEEEIAPGHAIRLLQVAHAHRAARQIHQAGVAEEAQPRIHVAGDDPRVDQLLRMNGQRACDRNLAAIVEDQRSLRGQSAPLSPLRRGEMRGVRRVIQAEAGLADHHARIRPEKYALGLPWRGHERGEERIALHAKDAVVDEINGIHARRQRRWLNTSFVNVQQVGRGPCSCQR